MKIFNTIIISILFFSVAVFGKEKERIAFISSRTGSWELWIMDLNGANLKQLTNTLEDERWPGFSADGKKIIFGNNRGEICLVNTDGTNLEKLKLKQGNYIRPAWSPDNKRIVYSSLSSAPPEDGNIFEIPIEKDGFLEERELIFGKGVENYAAFSSDGTKLIYSLYEPPRKAKLKEDVLVFDIVKNSSEKLIMDGNDNIQCRWSPDGKNIVYTSDKSGSYQVWVIASDGRGQKQLTKSLGFNGSPCYSPDGEKIVFVSNRSGGEQLWIMNSDGSNQHQITFPPGDNTDPVWQYLMIH